MRRKVRSHKTQTNAADRSQQCIITHSFNTRLHIQDIAMAQQRTTVSIAAIQAIQKGC